MPDREKVIEGLERIQKGCPYAHFNDCLVIRDALALLREQDAVEPIPTGTVREIGDTGYYTPIFLCGNCSKHLPIMEFKTEYCPFCGRKVDWE